MTVTNEVIAYAAEYPQAIRIRPTNLLDWGAREATYRA
jgi:hypothetical protein